MKSLIRLIILLFIQCKPAIITLAQFVCLTSESTVFNTLEAQFNAYVLEFRDSGVHLNTDIKIIPTVVHVVMITQADSLPLSRVENQIEQTNRHLRRLNIDSINTRDLFKPYAADCHIELCLVSLKPGGEIFQGVLWHHIADYSFEKLVQIIESTILDPDRYFNVWAIPGEPFGMGVFPWMRSHVYDGVAVSHYNMGYNLGGDDPNNQGGKLFTHEVGHYLGLYHTFHNGHLYLGNCALLDCDTTGDRCCDTPLDWSHFPFIGDECDFEPKFCPDGSYFYTQNENYMYYNPDKCLNMFSQDQRIRMRACLYAFRDQLSTSENLTFTGTACQPLNIEPDTGIENLVLIFPNPTTDELNIQVTAGRYRRIEIRIYNIYGQMQLFESSGSQTITICLREFPAGMYFIQASVDGNRVLKKFIKADR